MTSVLESLRADHKRRRAIFWPTPSEARARRERRVREVLERRMLAAGKGQPEPAPRALPPSPDGPDDSALSPPRVFIADIMRGTAAWSRVPIHEILAHRRTAKVVMARQIAMWLGRELTFLSYPDIGRRIGGRDHTTVMHACRKIDRIVGVGGEQAEAIIALRESLRAAAARRARG